jgi:hypothetical protein
MEQEAGRVSLEDVTQAAVSGVLRALEARQSGGEDFLFLPWPILVGVIMNPGEAFLTSFKTASPGDSPTGE